MASACRAGPPRPGLRKRKCTGCRCWRPHLPLAIPAPVAKGKASEDFPFSWSVCRWLEGDNPLLAHGSDCAMARDLARFLLVLRSIGTDGGRRPGSHNFWRGVDLKARGPVTRDAITDLHGTIDTTLAMAAWEADSAAPAWAGEPVWIHGDLSAGNLLERDERLNAVIDFGGLGVGDPACDLIIAWSLFRGEARAAFREALKIRRCKLVTRTRLGAVHGAGGATLLSRHQSGARVRINAYCRGGPGGFWPAHLTISLEAVQSVGLIRYFSPVDFRL